MNKEKHLKEFKIPVEGSLGILALGDVGLRAWRRVKKEYHTKPDNEKK